MTVSRYSVVYGRLNTSVSLTMIKILYIGTTMCIEGSKDQVCFNIAIANV